MAGGGVCEREAFDFWWWGSVLIDEKESSGHFTKIMSWILRKIHHWTGSIVTENIISVTPASVLVVHCGVDSCQRKSSLLRSEI